MKNIVLIGAGRGIGLELGRLLDAENQLYLITRQATPEWQNLSGEKIILDVSRDDIPGVAWPEVIHSLIYCPGSIRLKPFHRLTESDYLEDFQQNVLGAVRVLQKSLPALKRADGASVVLFSTVAVKLGMPFHASIAAAKGALEAMGKSLAAEWAPYKIRVNIIAPSLTDTPLAQPLLNTEEKRNSAAARHPLHRIGNPGEIARLAAFLISDPANWITGQVIGIDGGLSSLKM
jgi:3-oxoacyl-[acyl-carrier protein] reductase